MRERLHIKFKSILGSDFVSEFYDDETGKLYKESVIESVYNNKTLIASGGNIEIIKYGHSDGLMQFKYLKKEKAFYGYQETKRNVSCTDVQLKKQLLQVLKYLYDAPIRIQRKVKVVCLNSEKFYAYVFIEDLKELITSLQPLFRLSKMSASQTWKDQSLKNCIMHIDIPFKIKKMPTDVDLANIQREIYLNCL